MFINKIVKDIKEMGSLVIKKEKRIKMKGK
jgi:hypothetical protein